MFLFKTLSRIFLTTFIACLSILSISSFAQSSKNQTLVMVGGALNVCSSAKTHHCTNQNELQGKQAAQFKITERALTELENAWPSNNESHRKRVIQVLSKLAKSHSETVTKSALLWAWRDIDNESLSQLSSHEFNFMLDMLEVAVLDSNGNRLKEQVFNDLNLEQANSDIVDFVGASIKVSSQTPTVLVITAADRDPYASADFYESLFENKGIKTEWLALTPASAFAITHNQCADLKNFRQATMHVYNREQVYADRVLAEQAMCDAGIKTVREKIQSATAVIFNDEQQTNLQQVLFDNKGNKLPWFDDLQSRPVIMSTGVSSLLQAGGQNTFGSVPSIISGGGITSLRDKPIEQACMGCVNEQATGGLIYSSIGGLGTFNYGPVDSQFSENNRMPRLMSILNATGQRNGFGIDEATALVMIHSTDTRLMTVIGQSGVTHIQSEGENKGLIDYWPTGAVIEVKDNDFTLSKSSTDKALPTIKIPPLPMQRFGNIFEAEKLRSLLQAICLTQEKQAVAQQDEFLLALNANKNTEYHRLNNSQTGCAVSNLAFSIKTF
ncbi:cyanophycinase [Pseudoalteromonas sp. L1]|uniref:cyanophycinase n=1 Tax=Pseudoalteromonas sp. L1 TaxID=195716 RepID=UPI001F44F3D4|nr:cyanophycinase [Pseudoalteromonas sp. L1]